MSGRYAVQNLISERNLEIHFMPIVRLQNGSRGSSWRSVAFEALVRGPAKHSLRSPAQLFSAAMKAGVRQELELLCVDSALQHRSQLPEGTRLFLNVGLGTFQSRGFMDLILNHPPEEESPRTVVEVLEDEVPESRSFRERVGQLEGLGYDVALDDLTVDGNTLRRLIEAGPVRYWKLDRSVMRQWAQERGWVRNWLPMVTQTAKQMGIGVVLEGIENPDLCHLPALCDAGVTLGQGFVFGKPAILGPGLSRWRQGFYDMLKVEDRGNAPVLEPVTLDGGLRKLLHRVGHWI